MLLVEVLDEPAEFRGRTETSKASNELSNVHRIEELREVSHENGKGIVSVAILLEVGVQPAMHSSDARAGFSPEG